MTSIIEQADAIVGIDAKSNRAVCGLPPRMIEFVRRGAYVEWFIHDPARSIHEMRVPSIAHNTLEDLAREIVRLHKPKGDGLPEVVSIHTGKQFHGRTTEFVFSFNRPITDERHATAMSEYIMRCLAPPVRRLLAMYDVVDEKPARGCVDVPHVSVRGDTVDWFNQNDICWLVPRGER